MNFYTIILHLHSALRWVLLLFMLASIVLAINGKSTRKSLKSVALAPAMWSMAAAHLQLIIGLVLYFISPKVVFSGDSMKEPVLRFFLVEHIMVMILAIILVTVGYIKAKRATEPSKTNRNIVLFFVIALILFLSRIPWPFMNYGGKWI